MRLAKEEPATWLPEGHKGLFWKGSAPAPGGTWMAILTSKSNTDDKYLAEEGVQAYVFQGQKEKHPSGEKMGHTYELGPDSKGCLANGAYGAKEGLQNCIFREVKVVFTDGENCVYCVVVANTVIQPDEELIVQYQGVFAKKQDFPVFDPISPN